MQGPPAAAAVSKTPASEPARKHGVPSMWRGLTGARLCLARPSNWISHALVVATIAAPSKFALRVRICRQAPTHPEKNQQRGQDHFLDLLTNLGGQSRTGLAC